MYRQRGTRSLRAGNDGAPEMTFLDVHTCAKVMVSKVRLRCQGQ